MDPWKVGLALAVYALILWVVLFMAWRKAYQEWRENRASRLMKHHARVMDRRERIRPTSDPAAPPSLEHYALFEYEGRQQEFKVDPSIYEIARVGQEGFLYMRGGRFEAFEPKSEGQKADDVYHRIVKR